MENMGRITVLAAFAFGAYLTALDKESVDWTLFLPVVLIGVVGVVLVRRANHANAQDAEKLAESKTSLTTSLDNIIAALKTLDADKASIPTYDMRFRIDAMLRDDLFTFAENRDAMKTLYGLEAYADIMSSFAAGERYVNRVWSASTDGYVDEVITYVGKSLVQFEDAKSRLALMPK